MLIAWGEDWGQENISGWSYAYSIEVICGYADECWTLIFTWSCDNILLVVSVNSMLLSGLIFLHLKAEFGLTRKAFSFVAGAFIIAFRFCFRWISLIFDSLSMAVWFRKLVGDERLLLPLDVVDKWAVLTAILTEYSCLPICLPRPWGY